MAAAMATAAAQSSQPQPRVSYAMHSARINQIRATPDYTRLVSVSQDKTVRVWRMADLRLVRTLHVPSEPGEEGALRSLAITPDGREAIVAGWTGISWGGKGQLYRFDLATGRLLQTLRGLPGIVESLAISADGRRLAVGLGGTAGLRVLELPSGRELVKDSDYGERVSFADFSRDGTLATTSQDGCVRLYDPQGKLTFRAQYPVRPAADGRACRGGELGGIRFSPDGRQLAFGLQDQAEMVVMDAASRQLRRVLKVDDPRQRSLCCLNWSADSKRLFMNGVYEGEGATPMYVVDLASGEIKRMDIGRQRFTNILPLPNGQLAFSTSAPSLGLVDANGRKLAEALPPNGDFRFDAKQFQLSADGARITLPMQADGGDRRTLDIRDRNAQAYRRATEADLAAGGGPRRDGTLRIEGDFGEYGYKKPVTIGGTPIPLKSFQSVRSWAQVPGRELVALGTQWSVLVVDKHGKPVWERNLPAPAYQVNVSADGRWVVAAAGDGSLRWYSLEQGTETLGAFLHANGEDWVVWRADGFYKSSPGGDNYFGWLTNAGDGTAPRFVRAVQVERKLYRPDLVEPTLAQPGSESLSASLASTLAQLAAPEVTIESIRPGARPGSMDIRYSARAAGQPIRELGVYVDGIPVLRPAERQVAVPESSSLERVYTIPVFGPVQTIRVEAETTTAIGLDETAPLVQPPALPRRSGKLWVVAAGVDEFDSISSCRATGSCRVSLAPLPNTASDVRVLANELALQKGLAFSGVEISVLAGTGPDAPTKHNLLARLKALESAQPEDTVIVFLASHGFASNNGVEYYFVPKDGTQQDILAVVDPAPGAAPVPGAPMSLVSGSELSGLLRRVPGRRILLLDTCHSGAADGRNDPYTLYKRSASAQVAVLSASRGDEKSWEDYDAAHGAFTLAVLEALRGRAGGAKQAVTLRDVYDYSRPRVIENARRMSARWGRPYPQTPTLTSPDGLRETVLALRSP
ncbi:caspase family protein [Massilia sp. METH4]|uniref:caspase family protein n=1 Tax=Massilia sp. METH4 TaxID=3123041 RepID=UPI0030D32AD6